MGEFTAAAADADADAAAYASPMAASSAFITFDMPGEGNAPGSRMTTSIPNLRTS